LLKRRNAAGFSRIPSRLAHRARPIRQYRDDATLSRLLPPSPPTRGEGCLQLHPAAATAGRSRSSTPIRTDSASWRTSSPCSRRDRPALLQCLVVFHVLLVVVQVGDGPVHVGEVAIPLAGVRAGSRCDGGEGGGDGFGAAVQDAEQLPAGPLAGEHRVAGVQGGCGLAVKPATWM